VEKEALMRLASPQEIEGVVNQVFAENPQAVQDALVEEKAIHYLVGQVMKATGGKADPQLTNQIVRERMKEARPGG